MARRPIIRSSKKTRPGGHGGTIWLFREQLTKANAIEKLFARFDKLLKEKVYLAMSGQILDASLVRAHRQYLNDGEKTAIKEGRTAREIWPDEPAKAAQKDVDARYTVKFSKAKRAQDYEKPMTDIAIPVFGYTEQDREQSSRKPAQPHRHRPSAWSDPYMAGHRCCGA